MRGSWPVVGLVALLVGCATTHTALEQRVAAASLEAWDQATLGEPIEACRVAELRIVLMPTVEALQEACAAPGQDPAHVHAWACLRWRLEAPRVRTIRYPAALISPLVREDRHAAAAAHELLHALGYCANTWPGLEDPYDREHTDPRVWESGGPASVEQLIERLLEAGPDP